MTVSRFKTILPGDVRTVWDIVTGVMEYPAWRSDVERVETPGAQNRPLGGRIPAAGRGDGDRFY